MWPDARQNGDTSRPLQAGDVGKGGDVRLPKVYGRDCLCRDAAGTLPHRPTGVTRKAVGVPQTIRRYLGLTLLSQTGVTVGLALLAATRFPSFGGLLLNAVLASTILNELLAPPLSRYAINKAGESHVHDQ